MGIQVEAPSMFRRAREYGPLFFVPFAWTFTTAVHLDLVGADPSVLIAHAVMDVLLAGFAITSWTDMAEGALEAWRWIVVVGFAFTLGGTAGLVADPSIEPLLWVSLVGWMVLPAAGLVYTGWAGAAGSVVYYVGGALSAVGAVVYVAGYLVGLGTPPMVAGLALVGIGQTAGIANAAYQS